MSDIDWSKAPAEAMYALSTGPKCDGSKSLIGAVRYAIKRNGKYVESGDESGSTFCMGKKSWIVIAERPNAWTGEGLPPVGTVCEVMNNTLDNQDWERCTILFMGKFKAVYESDSCHERVADVSEDWMISFRPIRTPEQIAAEEREKEIDALCSDIVSHYEAPKMSEHYLGLAKALHKAGYRKTEAP